MANWRMQLHPNAAPEAMRHAVESLAAGYIGLDFGSDIGDLLQSPTGHLTQAEKTYLAFANEMVGGDRVLVVVHHFPFALATVDGPYNYIRECAPELGVWFRHFRKVRDVMYYADYVTNPSNWPQTTMTNTICPLRRDDTESFRLIENWIQTKCQTALAVAE